jgi:hypothetical protein
MLFKRKVKFGKRNGNEKFERKIEKESVWKELVGLGQKGLSVKRSRRKTFESCEIC